MSDRIIDLSGHELNPRLHDRHWVNEVTPTQEHLFAPGGLFGSEVRPLLYDLLSTRWILRDNNGRYISVLEVAYKPYELVPFSKKPLTAEYLIKRLTTEVVDFEHIAIEPESYGGRQPTLEELRQWRPWNLDQDNWSKWIRYRLPEGVLNILNKAHAPGVEWSDEVPLDKMAGFRRNWGIQFRPVLGMKDEKSSSEPSNVRLVHHIYEKAFYVWNEGTENWRVAKLLEAENDHPARFESVWKWVQAHGYAEESPDSVICGVRLHVSYDSDSEEEEQQPLYWRTMKPWKISEHGEPGVAKVDDWEKWLRKRDSPASTESISADIELPVRPPERSATAGSEGSEGAETVHESQNYSPKRNSPTSSQYTGDDIESRASQSSNTPPSTAQTSPHVSPPLQSADRPSNVSKGKSTSESQSASQTSQSSKSKPGKGKSAKRR